MRAGFSSRSSFTGLVRRQAVRRRFEAALATSGALASIVFIFAVVAFVQARPNVPGLPRNSEFDGERAFADLKRPVSFGPRPPGSRALERSREFIVGELRAAGVVLDSFTASTPLGPIPMTNLVAKTPGTNSAVVIIAGHYDTKRTNFLFVGANDGGSSVAFLLEMARVLARRTHSATGWSSSTERRLCSVGPTRTACTVVGTSLRGFQLKAH